MSLQGSDSLSDFHDEASGSLREIDGAKSIMGELTEYLKRVTQFISEEIKSESRSIAADQLNLATEKLDVIAEGLRETAEKLREKKSFSLANIMEMGSESIMRLSVNFRVTNPEKLLSSVKDFARREPGLFLGAAVVGGFLLGQIFSSPAESKSGIQEFRAGKESSLEYRPGRDEEEYYVPH